LAAEQQDRLLLSVEPAAQRGRPLKAQSRAERFRLTSARGHERLRADHATKQSKREGSAMRSSAWLPLGVLGFVVGAASFAEAATISGTVTGPDGAPLRAAFVQARNAKTKITVSVLSNAQGRYHVDNLPAGEYRLQIR